MKTINKLLAAGLFSFAALTMAAQGMPGGRPQTDTAAYAPEADAVAGATRAPHHGPHDGGHHGHGHMGPGMEVGQPVDFQSVKISYNQHSHMFAAIDSVECCVHLVAMTEHGLDTVARFQTDKTYKRHDLKNILRPVSVGFMGPHVVVLASAANDTAYVAILDEHLAEVDRYAFRSPMYAMHIDREGMMVVGRNPYGYDINMLPVHGGPDGVKFGEAMVHHYRVAKQAEKIKQSDPVGVGLTAVAVAVVFLALVCIALILQGSGKLIGSVGKGGKKPASKGVAPVSAGSSADAEQEVYAAIAAAIHLYNDELHDEEEGIITIQKVEREWTPWNAKYYNMNHYFNNKR